MKTLNTRFALTEMSSFLVDNFSACRFNCRLIKVRFGLRAWLNSSSTTIQAHVRTRWDLSPPFWPSYSLSWQSCPFLTLLLWPKVSSNVQCPVRCNCCSRMMIRQHTKRLVTTATGNCIVPEHRCHYRREMRGQILVMPSHDAAPWTCSIREYPSSEACISSPMKSWMRRSVERVSSEWSIPPLGRFGVSIDSSTVRTCWTDCTINEPFFSKLKNFSFDSGVRFHPSGLFFINFCE